MLILASAQWTWCLVHVREQKATKTVWKCNEDLKKFIHVKQEARNQHMSFMEQHVGLQQRCAELDSGDDEDSSWDHFHLEHVSEFTRINSRVDETFQKKEAYLGPNVCTCDAASIKDVIPYTLRRPAYPPHLVDMIILLFFPTLQFLIIFSFPTPKFTIT